MSIDAGLMAAMVRLNQLVPGLEPGLDMDRQTLDRICREAPPENRDEIRMLGEKLVGPPITSTYYEREEAERRRRTREEFRNRPRGPRGMVGAR